MPYDNLIHLSEHYLLSSILSALTPTWPALMCQVLQFKVIAWLRHRLEIQYTIQAHSEQHSESEHYSLCLVLTWDVHTLFSVTFVYSSSSNEQEKIEKVIMGELWGISWYIERLNFLLHICYQCCEVKLIWMERLKHKVSLTYILNEATPGCTSWGNYRVWVLALWLCGRSWSCIQLLIELPGTRAIRWLSLTCPIPHNVTYCIQPVWMCVWASSLSDYMTQTANSTIALWKGRCRCSITCSVAHLTVLCVIAFQRKHSPVWSWPLPFMSSVMRVDSLSEKFWLMFFPHLDTRDLKWRTTEREVKEAKSCATVRDTLTVLMGMEDKATLLVFLWWLTHLINQ